MAIKQLNFVDNNPPSCDAAFLNSAREEINDFITSTGQTLVDGDPTQTTSSVGNAVSRAQFFIDSGATNAYVLTPQGNLKVHSGGTFFRFTFAPVNNNTGASTAVITFSDGATSAVPILDINGNALVGGELVATYPADFYFDGTSVYLLYSYKVTSVAMRQIDKGFVNVNPSASQGDIVSANALATDTFVITPNFSPSFAATYWMTTRIWNSGTTTLSVFLNTTNVTIGALDFTYTILRPI